LPPEPFLRFSQRTCPRSKTHVWGGFAQFHCRTSPIPKTGVGCIQSTSFCHPNHFFIFRNEHAQSTTLGPKLMFGVVLRNFVVARHPFRKRVVGVHTKHEFFPPEPFLRFLQRTCPIHYFRSKTHVWGGFAQFHCRTLMCTRWMIARSFDERVWNNLIGEGDDVHGPTTAFQRRCALATDTPRPMAVTILWSVTPWPLGHSSCKQSKN
jgi:hypothetical protein